MDKILVPLDFSEYSINALDFACQIARKTGKSIHALHVIDRPSDDMYNVSGIQGLDEERDHFYAKLVEASRNEMQKLIIQEKFNDVVIHRDVKIGNPTKEIIAQSENSKHDLVVMGTHGRSGLKNLLVGSNTDKVVRLASCPVISVKSNEFADAIHSIVFASDFAEVPAIFFDKLQKLQHLFNATLHLVKINTPSDFTTTRHDKGLIEQFVKKHGVEDYTINVYNWTNDEDGVICFAEDIMADIIAIGAQSRTGLGHLIRGSIAEDVVNHASRPVWTYRI